MVVDQQGESADEILSDIEKVKRDWFDAYGSTLGDGDARIIYRKWQKLVRGFTRGFLDEEAKSRGLFPREKSPPPTPVSVTVTPETLAEFRRLYRAELGKDLDDQQARATIADVMGAVGFEAGLTVSVGFSEPNLPNLWS